MFRDKPGHGKLLSRRHPGFGCEPLENQRAISHDQDEEVMNVPRSSAQFLLAFFAVNSSGQSIRPPHFPIRHTVWRVQDGVFMARQMRLHRPPTDTIWIGTQDGLLRLMVSICSWTPPDEQSYVVRYHLSLGARDGS